MLFESPAADFSLTNYNRNGSWDAWKSEGVHDEPDGVSMEFDVDKLSIASVRPDP